MPCAIPPSRTQTTVISRRDGLPGGLNYQALFSTSPATWFHIKVRLSSIELQMLSRVLRLARIGMNLAGALPFRRFGQLSEMVAVAFSNR